jgi:ArsR family transcriptional regulator
MRIWMVGGADIFVNTHMKTDLAGLERLFAALADPTRLRIVGLLARGDVCVCDLHESLRISQPKASRHLAYLRRAGIVEGEKRGLWVHYRLAPAATPVVQRVLDQVREALGDLELVQRDCTRLDRLTCCAPAALGARPSSSPARRGARS